MIYEVIISMCILLTLLIKFAQPVSIRDIHNTKNIVYPYICNEMYQIYSLCTNTLRHHIFFKNSNIMIRIESSPDCVQVFLPDVITMCFHQRPHCQNKSMGESYKKLYTFLIIVEYRENPLLNMLNIYRQNNFCNKILNT